MKGILYDIKKTLTGKFTIIIIILVVLLTLGLSYAALPSVSSQSSTPPTATASVIPDIYPVHGGFKIVDFAVNGYGKPVSGLSISSNVTNSNFNTVIEQFNGTTNSKGFVSFNFSTTDENVNYHYYSEYVYGRGQLAGTASWNNFSKFTSFFPGMFSTYNNATVPPNYLFVIPVKSASSDSLLPNSFLIYYAGPNSTHPPDMKIYYNVTNGTSFSLNQHNMALKNMTYYQTISGTNNTVVTVPIKNTAIISTINVAITRSNDSLMAYTTEPYIPVNTRTVVDGIIEAPYELLIPILGLFSAYFYYGKDKASGVLESIIVRPVTKGKIVLSRFLAGAVSFFLAIILSLAVVDYIVYRFTGTAMSTNLFFGILLGYFATAVAYSGIMYLVSQFTKSQHAMLGIGIGLFFFFVFIWGVMVDLILSSFHINLAVISASRLYVALSAISPSFIPDMVIDLKTGLLSLYGLSVYSVILVGIIWACVPAAISFFLARRRD